VQCIFVGDHDEDSLTFSFNSGSLFLSKGKIITFATKVSFKGEIFFLDFCIFY